MNNPRSWNCYATISDGGVPLFPGPKWWAALHGEPIAVSVTVDHGGSHWGWRPKGGDLDSFPKMIQVSRDALSMCFPEGLDGAIKAGKGESVRLRIERR